MKNDKRKKEIFRWIFLGGLLLFVTFPVCDFSCFYAVNTRMSGLIYVPSTDIDDGGKTRIGGHFFRKEFLPDVSLNSLGKWMYHTGNHFLSIIPFS